MVDFCSFLLFLCFGVHAYGVLSSFGALKLKQPKLLACSIMAFFSGFFLLLIAAIGLVWLFYTRDFSASYVFKHSSRDLSWVYTCSAFWSGKEGSHFLWALFMAFFATLVLLSAKKHRLFLPYLMVTFHSSLAVMSGVLAFFHNPFVRELPVPIDGLGLNPILQNLYMAIHPPILLAGYASLLIPFAFGLAWILRGQMNQEAVQTCFRWTLLGWLLLTAGILLGGRWAYLELGWGGYWSWDPVETMSLLPWSLSLANIHLLSLERKSRFIFWHPKVTAFITTAAFFAPFLTTFLVKTGLLSSVHSYTKGSIETVYVLVYLSTLGILFSLVLFLQINGKIILPRPIVIRPSFSAGSIPLFGTVIFFLVFALIIFSSFVLPVFAQHLAGIPLNFGASYFNQILSWFGIFSLGLLIPSFVRIFRSRKALIPSWMTASCLIHFGFLIMALGFLGNYRNLDDELRLQQGETKSIFEHRVYLKKVSYNDRNLSPYNESENIIATVLVDEGTGNKKRLLPSLVSHSSGLSQNRILSKPAILSSLTQDFHVSLLSVETTSQEPVVKLRVQLRPFANFVWLGGFVLLVGAILLFTKRFIALKYFHAMIWCLLLSIICLAALLIHSFLPGQTSLIDSPSKVLFNDIASELSCPACSGSSVLESNAPIAENLKSTIRAKLQEGLSKAEVLDYFLDRYGPPILKGSHPNVLNVLVRGTLGLSFLLWILVAIFFCKLVRERQDSFACSLSDIKKSYRDYLKLVGNKSGDKLC